MALTPVSKVQSLWHRLGLMDEEGRFSPTGKKGGLSGVLVVPFCRF